MDRPDLSLTMGSLTVNGEPAEGATVVLHPHDGKEFDDRGTRPRATVQADGTFEVTTYQTGDGAPPGTYRMAVLWLAQPNSRSAWDRLGGRFADPQHSGITVTVGRGVMSLDPIALDDVRLRNRSLRKPSEDPDGLE